MSEIALSEIAEIVRGVTFPKEARKKQHENGLIACLRTANVQREVEWADLWFIPPNYIKNNAQILLAGDILISTANSKELVGKVAFLGNLQQRATLGAFISAIRPRNAVVPKFLYYQINSPEVQAAIRDSASTTTNISNVSSKKLLDLRIWLPLIDDQHRIVAEIEDRLSRLEAGVAALKRVQANLRRYRAAALRSVFTGGSAGNDLPSGWRWTTLGEQFYIGVGATPSRKEPAYWGGSIPWVSSGEVQFCRIRETSEHITDQGLANSSTRINPRGSVLLAMIGQGRTRGQAAILEIEAANNQNCAAIWVGESETSPEFVYYWLMSEYEATRQVGSGNNQQALNKSLVQALPIPWPPLAEQHKIVTEIERRLSVVEETETQVHADLARAERLRASVLSMAFQ